MPHRDANVRAALAHVTPSCSPAAGCRPSGVDHPQETENRPGDQGPGRSAPVHVTPHGARSAAARQLGRVSEPPATPVSVPDHGVTAKGRTARARSPRPPPLRLSRGRADEEGCRDARSVPGTGPRPPRPADLNRFRSPAGADDRSGAARTRCRGLEGSCLPRPTLAPVTSASTARSRRQATPLTSLASFPMASAAERRP